MGRWGYSLKDRGDFGIDDVGGRILEDIGGRYGLSYGVMRDLYRGYFRVIVEGVRRSNLRKRNLGYYSILGVCNLFISEGCQVRYWKSVYRRMLGLKKVERIEGVGEVRKWSRNIKYKWETEGSLRYIRMNGYPVVEAETNPFADSRLSDGESRLKTEGG